MVENYSDKLCLVLNLWYLNQFLYTPHFKYEDLRVDALLFERHEFLFKFDLKSDYHHYVFAVLPLGLSTACYIFTKLMRPLVRYWHGRGLKAIVYLDDCIIAVEGESESLSESFGVQHDLRIMHWLCGQH